MKSKIAFIIMSIALLQPLVGCSDDDDSNSEFISTWKVDYNTDPRTCMNITLQVEGVAVKADGADKVAVFAGGECRGVASPTVLDTTSYFLLLVNFKQPDDNQVGEPVDLYYYSAKNDHIYKSSNTDLTMERDKSVGTVDKPYSPSWKLYR